MIEQSFNTPEEVQFRRTIDRNTLSGKDFTSIDVLADFLKNLLYGRSIRK